MDSGYVQVAPDSTGKSVDNAAITVPAGTLITGSDGTKTALTADAIYYRQRVVISDPENRAAGGVSVRGEVGQGALTMDADVIGLLRAIHETLNEIKLFITMFAEH
jgi:hypothetical protein